MPGAEHTVLPAVALTPGDPAGIGPDLALAAAAFDLPCRLAVIADPDLLRARADALGLSLSIKPWTGQAHQTGTLHVLAHHAAQPATPGVPAVANCDYVLGCLNIAARGCLDGHFEALVTGPVNKRLINDAGIRFSGHTEYLAQLTGARRPVMMLIAGAMRVALATTHAPLRDVPDLITAPTLTEVLNILLSDLVTRFGLDAPRIGVCGLNPHAGEGGHLGTEERDIIGPVLGNCRRQGHHVDGPLPADTLFVPDHLRRYDAVLAMYHDQGLPVLKHAGFGSAVNVTLGLPIVRTSVDHGTAYDLAGTGRADSGSLRAAIDTAIDLCRTRLNSSPGERQ